MLSSHSILTSVTLFLFLIIRNVALASDVVFGYLPTWQLDKAEGVDLSKYTHITIAFAVPSSDGHISMDNREEVLKEWVGRLSENKIKVLVSLGGWTGSKYMSPIMKDKAKRTVMIDDMVAWMKDYELDGWDVDFEYPGRQGDSCHPFDSADTANFLEFVQELRQRLNSEFEDAKLITLATRFQPFDGPSGPMSDVSDFAGSVDYFNLMLYDFNGVWSETTGPNAPFDFAQGKGLQFSFKSSIQSWIDAGIPANKINGGIPFYGRTVTATTDMSETSDMYQSLVKQIPQGDSDDREETDPSCGGPKAYSGIWKYANLRSEGALDTADSAVSPWIRQFDDVTYTPWLYNTETQDFVSYDDTTSIAAKAQFARDAGLAGLMVWHITNDYENELLNALTSSLN
ncbi:chitinase [Coemansia reversa NRRL 1564]|uniref:Chitinase n=1 Tax=Coemansia reversa (strain ATCC 12441 / NRRL 1564) TaxID=763665 RepID=A0A2G5B4Z3_COERN|nr:chitinase [Coemansia reversa NRRL 1564]|eukprot:PIA14062.1 chitinase [Coemansia reversa NRRL 1564]